MYKRQVYNLKSCSGEYSSRVVVKEYTINQIRDDILKDIYLEQPDVVCFSCYIWNISFVRELVPDLKKILPQVEFWAGGPEVSYDCLLYTSRCPAESFSKEVLPRQEHLEYGSWMPRLWEWVVLILLR